MEFEFYVLHDCSHVEVHGLQDGRICAGEHYVISDLTDKEASKLTSLDMTGCIFIKRLKDSASRQTFA